MNFPVTVTHRGLEAVVYAKTANYPYYRIAYRAGGKRIVRSFSTFAEARKSAKTSLKDLWKGRQTSALSAKEVADAFAIRDALESFRATTGIRFTAIQAVSGFLDVMKRLPRGQNLSDAIEAYLATVVSVKAKLLSEAVEEFCRLREAKTVSEPGKRPALDPVYAADTARKLRTFSATFPATLISDLTKAHLDQFFQSLHKLSPKSRNHFRTNVRMFLDWCTRRDYLPPTTRLLEADGFRKEAADNGAVDFYGPEELRKMLDGTSGSMRAVIALQALAGLRLQEALRLDWRDVFKIPGHIEVSIAKSKTRQRRLVEIPAALERWLDPFRNEKGPVAKQTLSVYTHEFSDLRKELKLPSRKNGLRHGFVTYHFAVNANEHKTAAQAGNSPAMIHAHYRGLATKADGEKWFAVSPSTHSDSQTPSKKAKARKHIKSA